MAALSKKKNLVATRKKPFLKPFYYKTDFRKEIHIIFMLAACARNLIWTRVLASQINSMTPITRSVQGSYTYEWPRPAVTVDAILVSKESPSKVLLIQRKHEPFAGNWAAPGGFVDEMEPLHKAAARLLLLSTQVLPYKSKLLMTLLLWSGLILKIYQN